MSLRNFPRLERSHTPHRSFRLAASTPTGVPPLMLAFTFPGQGSQRPGMGRPWAERGVVGARGRGERDRGTRPRAAAARRRRRRAEGHAQRAALHVRLEPRRARRDRAHRPRRDVLRGPQPRRVHRARRNRRARRSTRGCSSSPSAPRRCTRAGQDQPGTMAAVLGLDDDEVEIACRRARQRRVGRELQRSRTGRDRRLARRCRVRRGARQGARREEGAAASGERRVPHAVHGAGARPLAQGDRRGEAARHRRPGHLERRRARARPGRRLGEPALRAAVQPRAMAPVPASPSPMQA